MPAEADSEAPAPYWKCVVAAMPEVFVGLQFWLATVKRPTFFDLKAADLTGLMRVEFLVLHSTAFLGALALWRPDETSLRVIRAIAFWGLFAVYGLFAMSGGTTGLGAFVTLTFATYLGLFLNWRSSTAIAQLGVRWLVGLAVFVGALTAYRVPGNVDSWYGSAAVLRAGAAYFFVLAALELSGLFQRGVPRLVVFVRGL